MASVRGCGVYGTAHSLFRKLPRSWRAGLKEILGRHGPGQSNIDWLTARKDATGKKRLDHALDHNGLWLDRPWMLAVGARCRSMWLAAHGDVAAADQMVRQALREHERLPMPFELARTQLLHGQRLRRQRRRDAAAAALRDALHTFDEMGATRWAERARAELDRTRTSAGQDFGLTPSEQRVAELAASGMTNRDVAAKLFISPKTLEHNLARAYRKLGIRSRAELGQHIGELTLRDVPYARDAVASDACAPRLPLTTTSC